MKNIYNIIEKDTIFFDIETTGVDQKNDRIIEICAIKYRKDKTKVSIHKYFNPEIPIHEKALEVHGITNEFLSEYATFGESVDELYDFFQGCDLGGYNCIKFDVPFLFEEFSRYKKKLNIFKVNIIDSYRLLTKYETRKLNDVYKKFFNKDIENAHGAEDDIEATIKILEKQIEIYGLEDKSIEDISKMLKTSSDGDVFVDLSGWFKVNEKGTYLYGKGKYKDNPVDIDLSYLNWIVSGNNEIENNSKLVAEILLDNHFKVKNNIN